MDENIQEEGVCLGTSVLFTVHLSAFLVHTTWSERGTIVQFPGFKAPYSSNNYQADR